MENTAMVVFDRDGNAIQAPETTAASYSLANLLSAENDFLNLCAPGVEISPEDRFNMVSNPAARFGDSIGEQFNLVGISAHQVPVVTNKETGEVEILPRIILIGSKGESYVSVSKTVYSSLKNLFGLYAKPEQWPKEGIPVRLQQTSVGEKRYFSIGLISKKK